MKNREFYGAIINGTITDEVIEHATQALEKLDSVNASRKAKATEKQVETDNIVIQALTTEHQFACDIAKTCDLSTSAVVASCKRLADQNRVVIGESKKNSRITKTYALAE